MSAQQLGLVTPRPAPRVPGIDLRCCDVREILTKLEEQTISLIVADPPWDLYKQEAGGAEPELHYPCLTERDIGDHLELAMFGLRDDGRLALWTCWPLLVEVLDGRELPPWLRVPGLIWRTGGAWTKTGTLGVGYHWRGHSEPVLIGTPYCASSGRPKANLRSGYASEPEEHSRKPAAWMADWIRAWVPPGGLVLDLYAGLGSVAEAVVLAGESRRYLGAEIDPGRHAAASTKVFHAWRRG